MTLRDIPPSKTCVVQNISGSAALRRRLLNMGITPGTRIMVRKMAPLGDPMEIRLRGYELTLRKAEAAAIEVSIR